MTAMRRAGLYSTEQIRPVNELKMRARHKLGLLLVEVDRKAGPGRGKKNSRPGKSFLKYLKGIDLNKNRAQEAQRISTLPYADLEKALAVKREADTPHADLARGESGARERMGEKAAAAVCPHKSQCLKTLNALF